MAVVSDTSADLPDPVLDRHHISLVPLQVVFGDETFRDRVELKPNQFYRRLRGHPGPAHHFAAHAAGLRTGAPRCPRAWIAGMLDVKRILSLDATGRVIPVDRVRGKDSLVPRVLGLLEQRVTPRPTMVRFGVAHAEAPEMAERVRNALVAAYQPGECFVTLGTGVLATHVGPGAWAVFYQVEDGPAGGSGRRDQGTTQ